MLVQASPYSLYTAGAHYSWMNATIRMSINQVEYTTIKNGVPIIHLFGRGEDGVLHKLDITGFRPYFYIPEAQSSLEHPEEVILDRETSYVSIYGNPVLRAYVTRPSDVREVRDRYTHYEADVTFTSRFLIDNGLTGGVESPADYVDYRELKSTPIKAPLRTCILDIECTDERGFPDADTDEILCLTCWDSFDNTFVTFFYNPSGRSLDIATLEAANKGKKGCYDPDIHTVHEFGDEKAMLTAFIRYLKDKNPDVLTGWNSVDFDMPYIVRRMEMLGMKTEMLGRLPGTVGERGTIRGRSQFDLLAGYKRMKQQQQESYRLDAIAEEELGRKKVHFTGRMCDMWRDNPEKLVEYNFVDVDLCVGINKKNRIIDFFMEVAHYVGCPFEKTMVSSVVVDNYILRRAHGKYVLPSKGQSTEEMFEGALVLEPSLGLKENVVVFDLKALYPMSMMTLNASPETKDPNGELVAPNGVRFRKSPDGLTRSILAELMTERDNKKKERDKYSPDSEEYKVLDMQQDVLKIIMNTYYGVSGYARFRLYDREIASATTATGRDMISATKTIIEAEGYKVIYGDTDSNFCAFPPGPLEDTLARAKLVEDKLNEFYPKHAKDKLNADKSYFSIRFQKIYKLFFQAGKKKRYAGNLIYKEGKTLDIIDIVGFEIRRSDTPHIARKVMRDVMEMILRGKTYEEVRKYLREFIGKYMKGEFSLDEIGIPGGIQKNLDDYENADSHVRGARYSNEHLGTGFKRGSKPKRVYIRDVTAKYPKYDVICFEYGDQVPKEFVIDYDVMLDKTIRQPIMRIIEPLGWKWENIDPSVTTLASWGI
jgi:DNA polymerase I